MSSANLTIPKLLESTCFSTTERFIIKSLLFIKGTPFKKEATMRINCSGSHKAGLETFYATLLISTIE
ncbi:hypothetical protein CXF85_00275 [Colwellia sp. 75C3]|nr:hypothetical protein CXF85_00275 [Colwellia sp. 75C3]